MRPLRYLLVFSAAALGALLLLIAYGASPGFLAHDARLASFGYAMQLRHIDCDILLYGDSAALHNLDPAVVTATTGLSACNIAEPISVQGVVGTQAPLDAYLQHNPRPRFLVLAFTPSFFTPFRPPFSEYHPEGVLCALRYLPSGALYLGLLRRPRWLIKYGLWTGRTLIHTLFAKPPATGEDFNRPLRRGYSPFPGPPETHCTRNPLTPAQDILTSSQGLDAMRRRYAIDGTQVFFDITPAADCDLLLDAYRTRSAGIRDNPLPAFPIHDFAQGDLYLNEAGVQLYSRQIGEQVLAAMHTPAPAAAR